MKLYPDSSSLTSRLISFGIDAKILYCARVGEFFDVDDPIAPPYLQLW